MIRDGSVSTRNGAVLTAGNASRVAPISSFIAVVCAVPLGSAPTKAICTSVADGSSTPRPLVGSAGIAPRGTLALARSFGPESRSTIRSGQLPASLFSAASPPVTMTRSPALGPWLNSRFSVA